MSSHSPISEAAITVAASTSTDARSSFSDYGSWVDIFAPGSAITSLVVGGSEETWNGTSMATPHVAGVAALWLQANPTWGPEEVWPAVQDAATRDKISDPMGSPNLLLYSGFESGDPCIDGGCPPGYVHWISDVALKILKNGKTGGSVTVQVAKGEYPNPVGSFVGVTVFGEWTVNSSTIPVSGVTRADGMVEFSSGLFRKVTEFPFCVTGLAGSIVDPGEEYFPVCSPGGTGPLDDGDGDPVDPGPGEPPTDRLCDLEPSFRALTQSKIGDK